MTPGHAVLMLVVAAIAAGGGWASHVAVCRQRLQAARRDVQAAKESGKRAVKHAKDHNRRFANAFAHDVREPLRAMAGFAGILDRELAADIADIDLTQMRNFAGRIVNSAARMDDLIRELRAYTLEAMGNGSVKCAPAQDVIDGAIGRLATVIKEEEVELIQHIDLAPGTQLKTSVGRVLQNLVDNAIKYAGPGHPRVELTARADGDAIEITVTDNGMGFDPADSEVIFEMLRQLHPHNEHARGGFGMGLALCREIIVERLGGEIKAESKGPGTGATFRLRIPLSVCNC